LEEVVQPNSSPATEELPPVPVPAPELDSAPGPAPAPDPESLPVPEPSLEPAEPEPSAVPSVSVVSVDELIDRLLQGSGTEEEAPAEDEPAPEETAGEPESPGVIHSSYVVDETTRFVVQGMDELQQCVEAIRQTQDHPLMTTPFQDYTVTEGLLLLLLLFLFLKACINMVRRAFSWLL